MFVGVLGIKAIGLNGTKERELADMAVKVPQT